MLEEFAIVFQLIGYFVLMCVVLAMAYFATKWLGKKMAFKASSSQMQLIDKLYVDRDKVIVIVKIANHYKTIAMSSNAISDLGEIEELVEGEEPPRSMEFQDILSKVQDVWTEQKGKFTSNKETRNKSKIGVEDGMKDAIETATNERASHDDF